MWFFIRTLVQGEKNVALCSIQFRQSECFLYFVFSRFFRCLALSFSRLIIQNGKLVEKLCIWRHGNRSLNWNCVKVGWNSFMNSLWVNVEKKLHLLWEIDDERVKADENQIEENIRSKGGCAPSQCKCYQININCVRKFAKLYNLKMCWTLIQCHIYVVNHF